MKHVCSNYSQIWFMALPSHSEKCYPSSTSMQSLQPCPNKHSILFSLPIFFLTFSLNFTVFFASILFYKSYNRFCKSYIIYNHKVIWFLSFVLTNLFCILWQMHSLSWWLSTQWEATPVANMWSFLPCWMHWWMVVEKRNMSYLPNLSPTWWRWKYQWMLCCCQWYCTSPWW